MSEINEVGSVSVVFSLLVLDRMDQLSIVKVSSALRYFPSLVGMGWVEISEGVESWAPRSISRASYPSVLLGVYTMRICIFAEIDGKFFENKDSAVVLPGELNICHPLFEVVQVGKLSGHPVEKSAGLVRFCVIGERRRRDGMAPGLGVRLAGGFDLLNTVLLQQPGADDLSSAVGAR